MVRVARVDEAPHIEVLPSLDDLARANLATQDDGEANRRAYGWPVGRRRPLIRDDCRVHVLPAESRPVGIGEDVEGFDAHPRWMVTRGDGSRRQVPDLVGSAKHFTGRHDDPLGVGSDQLVKALYVIGS